MQQQFILLKELQQLFKNPVNIRKNIETLLEDNDKLAQQVQGMQRSMMKLEKRNFVDAAVDVEGVKLISGAVKPILADVLKDFAYMLKSDQDDLVAVLGADSGGKPQLAIIISENLVKERGLDAAVIVREAAKKMQGGGGGQAHFATAGGKNLEGLDGAIQEAVAIIKSKLTD